MTEHGICAKCKKSVGCSYADDRITGCKKFVLEPELELTNEEWLRSATTEQLADVLLEHFEWGLSINAEYCFTEKYVEQNREHILEWLKQPHTPKE